jgi:putative cardiolipin synthase
MNGSMCRRFGAALLLAAAALLGITGCTTLPPRIAPPESHAYPDTAATLLGRVAAASLAADAPASASGFRLLPDGEHAFDARIALIQAATRSVDAQYYHVHADTAGAAFLQALRDAAVRGVRVRLLVDDFYAGDLYKLLRGLAAHPNAEVRLFNPLLVRYGTPIRRMLLSMREMARVNHRMHNKLLVVDNQVTVFGGRNIADEYFTRGGNAAFLDLDVLAVGAVVRDLSASFDRYWNSEQAWLLEQRLHGWEKDLDAARRRADFDLRVAELGLPKLNLTPLDPLWQPAVRTQIAEGRL